MLVSHDAGTTWRESGRGLPPGAAVAIADWDPDLLVYAAPQPALRLAERRRLLDGARGRAARDRARSRSRNPELAARDDHRRAADPHALDPVGRALDVGVEPRRPPELDALHDLDLLAEPDPAVAGEVDGERARAPSRSPDPRRRRPTGANIRDFQRAPSRAKQYVPSSTTRTSAAEVRLERGDLPRASSSST